MTAKTHGYTEEQIDDMRSWVADCYDHDPFFDIDDLSDEEVIRTVRRDYGGGMRQFLADGKYDH